MHATLKKANLQCSPISHAQARVTREQDSSADSEPPPHSALPPNRAVEPSGPALHEHARAPAAAEEQPKSSRDKGTRRATRPEDRTLTRTSEGKMHPGAMHGRPPEPPSSYTRSATAWAPNGVDPKPGGRALHARQLDLDGGGGTRRDLQPQPGTTFEEQDVYSRASALLEGGKNNILLGKSEQAVARPTLDPARKSSWYA